MTSIPTSSEAVVVIADKLDFRERLRVSLEGSEFQVREASNPSNGSPAASLGTDTRWPDSVSKFCLTSDGRSLAVMIVSAVSGDNPAENRTQNDTAAPRAKGFRWGPLTVDFDDRRVVVAGRQVLLTQIEHSLLCILAEKAGKLASSQEITLKLWGNATSKSLCCLRVHACSLRRKLKNRLVPKLILTDPGLGYRLASAN